MQREHYHWHSPALHRDMEVLVFGETGTPVLVFPSSKGRFFEYEERGMVSSLAEVVERGLYQLYCVDSVDAESWYSASSPPRERILRHLQYERYVANEILPLIKNKNPADKLFVTGCSFGGYHAVNFALRHPDLVDRCISLSGSFDIRPILEGYYDEDCYFNNPIEYLPNLNDEWYLHLYRTKVGFVLATGEWDFCLDANLKLSRLFDSKGIRHWLDVWGDHTKHDWPWWQMMIKKFLS